MQIAFSVFLSWAIARELDPDSPGSANAAALAGALIFLTGEPQLWAVTALLFAVRILVRTTGRPPNLLDLAWLPALAAQSARSDGGLIAGLALACALIWDAKLPRPAGKRAMLSGVIAAAVAVAVAALEGTAAPDIHMPTTGQWTVYAAALVALTGLQTAAPLSVGDLTGERIFRERLFLGRMLAVLVGALTMLWLGGVGAPAQVGLWAALIGMAFNRWILVRVRKRGVRGACPAG
jgi:hypothetical protein